MYSRSILPLAQLTSTSTWMTGSLTARSLVTRIYGLAASATSSKSSGTVIAERLSPSIAKSSADASPTVTLCNSSLDWAITSTLTSNGLSS